MAVVLPNNLEAERALLGVIFLDEKTIVSISDEIRVNDFFDERNRKVFFAMQYLHAQNISIDVTTVVDTLANLNDLETAGGLDYIGQLPGFAFSTSNVDAYITLIKEASIKRAIIAAANDIIQKAYDPEIDSKAYIDYLNTVTSEISSERKTTDFNNIKSINEEVRRTVHSHMSDASGITGLKSGFSQLDRITMGFQPGTLNILAARPAMGKSAIAMNIAVNAAKLTSDGVVAIFSLEMSQEQLVERMIAAESYVKFGKIMSGTMTTSEWRLFESGINVLNRLNLYFDDSGQVTVSDIRAKCRKLKNDASRLDLIVIDYLQLINPESTRKNGSRQEDVAAISRGLKQLARELKVPILALAQLSREVEKREDKRPIMADLRDSGSIEQDADLVLFLYRDDYYKKEKSTRPGEADLIIGKNRNGLSAVEIAFLFQGEFARFKELSNQDNDQDKGEIK